MRSKFTEYFAKPCRDEMNLCVSPWLEYLDDISTVSGKSVHDNMTNTDNDVVDDNSKSKSNDNVNKETSCVDEMYRKDDYSILFNPNLIVNGHDGFVPWQDSSINSAHVNNKFEGVNYSFLIYIAKEIEKYTDINDNDNLIRMQIMKEIKSSLKSVDLNGNHYDRSKIKCIVEDQSINQTKVFNFKSDVSCSLSVSMDYVSFYNFFGHKKVVKINFDTFFNGLLHLMMVVNQEITAISNNLYHMQYLKDSFKYMHQQINEETKDDEIADQLYHKGYQQDDDIICNKGAGQVIPSYTLNSFHTLPMFADHSVQDLLIDLSSTHFYDTSIESASDDSVQDLSIDLSPTYSEVKPFESASDDSVQDLSIDLSPTYSEVKPFESASDDSVQDLSIDLSPTYSEVKPFESASDHSVQDLSADLSPIYSEIKPFEIPAADSLGFNYAVCSLNDESLQSSEDNEEESQLSDDEFVRRVFLVYKTFELPKHRGIVIFLFLY